MTSSSVNIGQVGVISGGAVYSVKLLPREFEVPLFVKSIPNWATTMRVVKAPEGICGRVFDAETGTEMPLVVGEEMTFTLPQGMAASGRFMVSLDDFARAEALMPSCPEALDGRVEVHVGEGVTANMSLLNSDGVVLDQLIGVEEVAEFVSVAPGDYSAIVTGTAGTTCPKSQREVSVPPGEEPELLGLDWTESTCNEEPVSVSFELYGGGTFGWTLFDDQGVAQQGAGAGEILIDGLDPGAYILDVDHACLQEFIEFEAFDPAAPILEADWNAVVIADSDGAASLQALFTGTADSYEWLYDGVVVNADEALTLDVIGLGTHEVVLQAVRGGCIASMVVEFTVAIDQKGAMEDVWTVSSGAEAWTLNSAHAWGHLDWSLYDVSGRLIQGGNEGEGQLLELVYPDVDGVYRISLGTGDARVVLTLITPVGRY